MPQDVEQAFEAGLAFEAFRAGMRIHAHAFNDLYERLAFVRTREAGTAPLGDGRILILTEEYCIDSVLNVPLVARLAQASPGASLRIASRDAHAGLASRFPGRGGVSRLPTVIFLGQAGQPPRHWSERSRRDHDWMATFLARDPMPDLTLYEGRPAPALANWMVRRLASQRPFFEAESWLCARDELRAIATEAAGD